jgi:tetratricopeptide (TPR) repeat protein
MVHPDGVVTLESSRGLNHFVYRDRSSWAGLSQSSRQPVIPASSSSLATHSAAALAESLIRLGQEHHADGRIDEAIAAYRAVLDAAAAAPDLIAPEMIARLHANLGNAGMARGDLESAAASYEAALRLSPRLTSCWCNLGNVQLQTGKAQEAIALYLHALKINPAHWPSRTNLAQALMSSGQYLLARALLLELAEARPQDGQVRHQLGKACFELNDAAALSHFQAAIALNPTDADSLYWIGGLRQHMGDLDGAQAAYARAAQIKPLIRRQAVKSPPDFRLLAIYAPFAGNTPAEFLFEDAAYDRDTLALLGAAEVDAALLGDVQLVVNLISDADQAVTVLPSAARLVAKLGKPVINDPDKVGRTTRDAIANLLPGIPACRVPRILRLEGGALVSAASLASTLPFSFPVLARPAGTHGGDDFEKIESPAELTAFLAGRPQSDHYIIEYADYASADGHFRKYRFIFIDEEILPYHLAIGNGWKVHHGSTDMANQPWMQREEAAFLANPGAVFDASHFEALQEIQRRIGLDYFGIDCALDASGNLIVFEVNASMLVHCDNAQFPYKDPHVRAIKRAFEGMLRKRAADHQAAQGK